MEDASGDAKRRPPRRTCVTRLYRPHRDASSLSRMPNGPMQGQIAADLPQHARERLTEMRQKRFFTSDLSVSEFLLIKETGFEPVGLVMGSSIYHIGYQVAMWSANQEMEKLTQALYHSRELAMTRMEEEADALGADGVVGVRLTVKLHAWGSNVVEFLAIGTAV